GELDNQEYTTKDEVVDAEMIDDDEPEGVIEDGPANITFDEAEIVDAEIIEDNDSAVEVSVNNEQAYLAKGTNGGGNNRQNVMTAKPKEDVAQTDMAEETFPSAKEKPNVSST